MTKYKCASGNEYEIHCEKESTHRDRFDEATWYLLPPCMDEADRKELEENRVVAYFGGYGGSTSWRQDGKSIYQKVWHQ